MPVITLAMLCTMLSSACGDDIQDYIDEYRNCEIIVPSNKQRCSKREIPNSISFADTQRYFQSRDVIYIGIENDLIDYGEYFSVINSTTEAVLIKDEPVPAHPKEYEGFSLFADSKVKVRIHPTLNTEHYIWNHVQNNLRVISRKGLGNNFRFGTNQVFLTDYSWFGAQAIATPRQPQAPSSSSYQVELWISEQAQPGVNDADLSVTVGGFSAMNPVH